MADKAFITPNILKWARESAKMSEEIAAAKVLATVEKLQEWENGTSQPTIKQAQTLAKAINDHLPYSFFQKYQEIFNLFRISEKVARKL